MYKCRSSFKKGRCSWSEFAVHRFLFFLPSPFPFNKNNNNITVALAFCKAVSLLVPVLLALSMRQLVECSQQSLGVTMLVLQKRRGREERLSNTTKKWQGWDVNRSYASPSTHSPSLHVYWACPRCLVLCRTPADEQSVFSVLWHSRRKTQQQATEGRQVLKNSTLESGRNRDTQTNRQKVFRIQYVVAKICHLVHFSQASKEAAALSSFLGTSLKLCCWFCNQMGQSLLSAQFLRVQKSFLKA